MSAEAAAAAWEQLPLGVQQRILVLTGSPCARRVSKAWRDAFDATNDTLCFCTIYHPNQSVKVAATAAATRVVKNSASLTTVNYVGQSWDTPLPVMLPDLLAARAAPDLATRLRKLTGVQLAPGSAVQQLRALRQCTGLTHLEINGTELRNCSAEQGHQATTELRAALQGMRSLTCLHLDSWQLQPEVVVTTFASALQPLTQLQHLHVVSSRLGAAGLAALVPALTGMRGLETLDVRNNMLGVDGAEGAQALGALLGVVPGLTHLDVRDNRIRDEGALLLAPVLRGMMRLQTLNMCSCSIHDGGMATLAPALAALPHLHTLDLTGNALGATAVSALQPVWGRERRPLRKLSLCGDRLELEGARVAAAGLRTATQLQRLSLSPTRLHDEGWAALAPALSCLAPSLQSLELGGDRFNTAGSATMALQMLTGLTRLHAVNVFTSGAMVTISPALMGMRRLQVLDLHWTAMSAEAITTIAPVLPALACSLKCLNLSNCWIHAESAANALAPELAQATGLVELHLDDNDFGPQGAQWLVPVLSSLPHLRKAGLSSCKLGVQGCMAVAHALKDRDGVHVHLANNGVTRGSTEGDELCNMAGIHIRLYPQHSVAASFVGVRLAVIV